MPPLAHAWRRPWTRQSHPTGAMDVYNIAVTMVKHSGQLGHEIKVSNVPPGRINSYHISFNSVKIFRRPSKIL